jgi:hypothetical protein
MAAKGAVMAKWESEVIEQERQWKGDRRSRESADVEEPETRSEPPQPLTRGELKNMLLGRKPEHEKK